MEITEVRVKLVPRGSDKLRAFCSITIDNNFVVRDLKIIEGTKGPFVAMPSRKLTDRCPRCGGKNHHRAVYCNDCGARLPQERNRGRDSNRSKLHADIAHPINSQCREMIQRRVLDVYQEEQLRSEDPDYTPVSLDDFEAESLSEFDTVDSRPFEPHTVRNGGGAQWGRASAVSGAAQAQNSAQDRVVPPWKREGGQAEAREEPLSARGATPQSESAWRRRREEEADRSLPPETVADRVDVDEEPEDNFGAGLFS